MCVFYNNKAISFMSLVSHMNYFVKIVAARRIFVHSGQYWKLSAINYYTKCIQDLNVLKFCLAYNRSGLIQWYGDDNSRECLVT